MTIATCRRRAIWYLRRNRNSLGAPMPATAPVGFARRLNVFCLKRVSTVLPPLETEYLRLYLLNLLRSRQLPPLLGTGVHWGKVGEACRIDPANLRATAEVLKPGFDALIREVRRLPPRPAKSPPRKKIAALVNAVLKDRDAQKTKPVRASPPHKPPPIGITRRRRRGRRPLPPVIEFPVPTTGDWEDPPDLCEALNLHMRRHGDSCLRLHRAVVKPGELTDVKTFQSWRRGTRTPRTLDSLEILGRIERRYRLPEGYFRAKLPHPARASTGHGHLGGIGSAERRRLAWHLPDDFDRRSEAEREEILSWVQSVVITGSTDYRRFQAAALKQRYGLRFPDFARGEGLETGRPIEGEAEDDDRLADLDPELRTASLPAPPQLVAEMRDLVRFKTSTLTAFGYQRNGVWAEETTSQRLEHLGLLFGALAASPTSAVRGLGVPLPQLRLGLLVFPAVWDWYIQWRERRRGFYTAWEVDMLRLALSMSRQESGWLRQNPALIDHLQPIPGLVSAGDIATARADWNAWCDTFHKHGLARARELQRVARHHRDPFEPILPILEAESPVGEYRKITEEIVRLMPDERRYPVSAAESVRSFLMLRFGLHLGLRQKNLRQLMLCPRGQTPMTERQLADLKRGEIRWNEREAGWEVLIPAIAFKNANSSYFGGRPFRLLLPDLGGLYPMIAAWIDRHRARLLRGADDPRTFFVKTVKTTSIDASYDQTTFYEAWRLTIQRFGIFNPYTGRGAIKGLLPHGPHNIRDVIATHILKQTGSYEQASYAIQDTPDMVAKHYGRFLPRDKAALAAQTLNLVWT